MRIFFVIVILSALALIPGVKSAVSKAIAQTRESIFSSLYQRSRINRNSMQRQRLNIGTPASTTQQESSASRTGNVRPSSPSSAVNVSEELRQNRWTTTKQIFY